MDYNKATLHAVVLSYFLDGEDIFIGIILKGIEFQKRRLSFR